MEKVSVELYLNNCLYKTLFVVPSDSYSLPVVEDAHGYTGAWFDTNNIAYSDVNGNLIKEISSDIKLYYISYKAGYIPIFNADDLKNIELNGKYVLINDIEINNTNWQPLGSSKIPFSGIFDGNGKKISNMKILSGNYCGLFAKNSGVIKNVVIENITINSSCSSDYIYAGGVAGYNSGGIYNSMVTGTLTVSGISFVYSGGITGYNYLGSLYNCIANVNVTAYTSEYWCITGGVVGQNNSASGFINNCYATGNIVSKSPNGSSIAGGFVGDNDAGVISNCFSVGNVSSTGREYNYNNCFAGRAQSDAKISNCFSLRGGNATSTSLTNLQSEDWIKANLWTYESNNWYFNSNNYPSLNYDALINSIVEISTLEELLSLQGKVLSGTYLITNDIHLAGAEWKPIKAVTGDFYGNGKTISGLSINLSSTTCPAFIQVNGGCIRDLNLNHFSIDITLSGDASGSAVCINNNGEIYNCSITGTIRLEDTSNSSYSTIYLGGIAAYNTGIIDGCTTYADIQADDFGYNYVGGIVGYNIGCVSNCNSYGMSFTRYASSYTYLGALVGYNRGSIYVFIKIFDNVFSCGRPVFYFDFIIRNVHIPTATLKYGQVFFVFHCFHLTQLF